MIVLVQNVIITLVIAFIIAVVAFIDIVVVAVVAYMIVSRIVAKMTVDGLIGFLVINFVKDCVNVGFFVVNLSVFA